MGTMDAAVFAERVMAVERHLKRVAEKLPQAPGDLAPGSDAADSVVLHLWQALQIVIDLAMSACAKLSLGTPATYADAFRRLSRAGVIDSDLGERLARAAGFRNIIVHAYEGLDLVRVHAIASHGPNDLRAFLLAMRDRVVLRPTPR